MKKIKFWQKNADKKKVHHGWLVEDKKTKFVVKAGDHLIEYHYPHLSYAYEIVEDK
tara:strand:+ start:903 stop:1070 length:168 start_codon:yes stop_codon:yes gene_type:complete